MDFSEVLTRVKAVCPEVKKRLLIHLMPLHGLLTCPLPDPEPISDTCPGTGIVLSEHAWRSAWRTDYLFKSSHPVAIHTH